MAYLVTGMYALSNETLRYMRVDQENQGRGEGITILHVCQG